MGGDRSTDVKQALPANYERPAYSAAGPPSTILEHIKLHARVQRDPSLAAHPCLTGPILRVAELVKVSVAKRSALHSSDAIQESGSVLHSLWAK